MATVGTCRQVTPSPPTMKPRTMSQSRSTPWLGLRLGLGLGLGLGVRVRVRVAQHALVGLVPRWGVRAEAGTERRCLATLQRAEAHDA